jgi:biotin carboxylase
MGRTILHLGGAAYHVRSIRVLRQAGFRVACLDRDPAAPGRGEADIAICGSVSDAVVIFEALFATGADAVVNGLEIAVAPAALASAAIGLCGVGVETALRCIDKTLMRAAWEAAGLAQPAWVAVRGAGELHSAIDAFGLPLVVKPARGNGSRGVSVVTRADEVEGAVAEARAAADAHGFIVERFVAGPLVTNDGFVDGRGKARVAVMGDVVTQSVSRHRVNTALNYPAALSVSDRAAVASLVERAAVALGLRRSPFHCEIILGENGPVLVELAARGGGSYIASTIVAAVSGLVAPVVSARLALGDDVSIDPSEVGGATLTFITAPAGVITAIRGLDEARALPGIVELGVALRPGERSGAVAFDNARHGHVVAVGATRDEAVARAAAAVAAIGFEVTQVPV